MGNEGSRPSTLRRNLSRRASKNQSSGHQYIAEDEVDTGRITTQDVVLQKPAMKRMDKIRRSLSFRKKKKSNDHMKLQSQTSNDLHSSTQQQTGSNLPVSASVPTSISTGKPSKEPAPPGDKTLSVKPPTWIEDEKKVRAGSCSFQVKYLGSLEVTDSRGMHLCETAIERLLSEKEKKKSIKAILYVSGDSLRVVDEANKTLLVDQTIEKVSFCAPDRHHENGFAYICRDGTTRRWLCYCFMAIKDTLKGTSSTGGSTSSGGERLSHAVGCAFSVCLEKKQKREKENVSMEVGPNNSFTRFGSFRQASLTERIEDPQMVMPAVNHVPIKQVDNPHAIARPKANPDAFTRQNSLRGTGALQMPFKRGTTAYTSLKPGELPSFQQQRANSFSATGSASTPVTKTQMLMQQHQQNSISTSSSSGEIKAIPNSQSQTSSINEFPQMNPINTISELPEEPVSNHQLNSTTNVTPVQLDWTQLNNIFPTPQSKPVSPRPADNSASPVTPPPLPPMPTQYNTPSNLQQQVTNNVKTQQSSMTPLQQQFNLMSMTPNQMYAQGSTPSYTAHQQQAMTTPSHQHQPSGNESFEQKWARIQAAKKTNPFAEDIAKKFEIKLT